MSSLHKHRDCVCYFLWSKILSYPSCILGKGRRQRGWEKTTNQAHNIFLAEFDTIWGLANLGFWFGGPLQLPGLCIYWPLIISFKDSEPRLWLSPVVCHFTHTHSSLSLACGHWAAGWDSSVYTAGPGLCLYWPKSLEARGEQVGSQVDSIHLLNAQMETA